MWIRGLDELRAAAADAPAWPLVEGPDGALAIRTPAGRLAHSLRRPREEARRAVACSPARGGVRPVLFGVGLGYWVEALLERPLAELLAVEADPSLLASWAERLRREPAAAAALDDGRLRLLFAAGDDELLAELGGLFAGEHDERPVVVWPACTEFWRPRLPRAAAWLEDLQARRRSAARQEWRLEENERANLPALERAKDFAAQAGSWGRVETVVCGAGPGLVRDLERLAEARAAGARLVAVNTAAPVLAARGLGPDLVVATDPDPRLAADRLDGAAPPLLVFPGTCAELVAAWPGELWLATPAGPGLHGDAWRGRRPGPLRAGLGTVAGPALDAAARLGTGPLRLVGVDLDATAGAYAAGVRRDPAAQLPDFAYARRQLALFVIELRRSGRTVEAFGARPDWLPAGEEES